MLAQFIINVSHAKAKKDYKALTNSFISIGEIYYKEKNYLQAALLFQSALTILEKYVGKENVLGDKENVLDDNYRLETMIRIQTNIQSNQNDFLHATEKELKTTVKIVENCNITASTNEKKELNVFDEFNEIIKLANNGLNNI